MRGYLMQFYGRGRFFSAARGKQKKKDLINSS